MLKLNPDPTFTEDIPITIPGKKDPGKISLTFKYRGKDEYFAFCEENKDADDVAWFLGVVVGWDGIDADFNKENVQKFLNNYPAASVEIAKEYPKMLLASRIKN